jgi:hypothetical protein
MYYYEQEIGICYLSMKGITITIHRERPLLRKLNLEDLIEMHP